MSVAPIVEALKQRRLAMGLSRREVAQQLHVATATVGQWERGERTPDAWTLERYAQAVSATLRCCGRGPVLDSGWTTRACTACCEPAIHPPLPDSTTLDSEVLVERACRGEATWTQLNRGQRIEVYRRLRKRGWGHHRIAKYLHVSWDTVAGLDEQDGAAA